MRRVVKSIKYFAVFLYITIFSLAVIYLPASGEIYAQNGIKVYIDAGHGGSDPGAVRFGLQEKDANLDIEHMCIQKSGIAVVARKR